MLSTIKDIQNRQAASVTEPITRAEAKEWCIISHTDDDALIDKMITRVRAWAESRYKISLVEREIVLTVDLGGEFKLPYGPVREITSIEFRQGFDDDDPDWETLTDEDFRTDGVDNKVIKTFRCGIHRITYTTGYGTDGVDYNNPVPDDLKNGLLTQLAFWYENRGDNNTKGKISETALILLAPYMDMAHV